jgi:hypothetical protein
VSSEIDGRPRPPLDGIEYTGCHAVTNIEEGVGCVHHGCVREVWRTDKTKLDRALTFKATSGTRRHDASRCKGPGTDGGYLGGRQKGRTRMLLITEMSIVG